MSKILQENKVLYIEPNAIDDTTKYTTAAGSVTKAPSLEDYCVVVDLEVEIKGRTYNSSKNGNSKNLTMEWQSRNSGQTVRFMEGSKIYTDSSKSSYVNSLTTNYTDIFLKDVEKQGTAEMFGINSIDISYNNFMVPEVTIQFTDVRGVSLFAQEEMRHNLVRNGMSGVANNDIEGSFFKCFFTFPYPRFTLKVKGYYGKMASYELTCSDFRAAFDSSTGNFNVTAKFVGYAFSFLNDVMVNALVAAPYSTYIGKEYWDSQVNSRFKVTDKNGSEVPMVKLGDICKAYKQIEEQVDTQLSQPGAYEDAAKDFNLDPNQQNALANSDPKLAALKEHYKALMDKLHNNCPIEEPAKGDVKIPNQPWPDSYSLCVISNYDVDKFWENMTSDIDKLNSEINNCADVCAPLKEWSVKYDLKIIKRNDWSGNDENDDLATKDNVVRSSIVKEERLRKAIEEQAKVEYKPGTTYHDLWSDGDASTCYVYQDFGLRKILENDNVNTDDANVVQQAQDEVRNTMMQNAFSDYFNFAPTLENITKIIMAHLETYVYMISTCSDNIISKGTGRSTGNLGVNEANFPDAKGNNSTNSEIVVAPFPKVTKRVTQEGVEKDEDTWIGEYGTSEKFEEIALVEGILNGIEEAAQAINYGARDANSLINNTVSSVSYPLSIIDIFMTENDNPFGDVDIKHPTDIFSRFAVRAFSLLGTVNESFESVSKTIGKIDSENFLVKYGKSTDINILKTTLQDTKINADYIFNYVTKQLTSPEGEWAKPAWPKFEKLVAMTNTKEKCYLSLGSYRGNGNKLANAIAVRNWNWASYSSDFSGNKVSTNNLSPYILPNSVKGVDENPTLLCVIKHKGLQFVRKSVALFKTAKYYSSDYNFVKETEFKKEEYNEILSKHVYAYDGEAMLRSVAEIIEYDDGGVVTNGDKFSIGLSPFLSSSYYNTSDIVEKAYSFITSTVSKAVGPTEISDTVLNVTTPLVMTVPQIKVLYTGAIYYKGGGYQQKVKQAIKDKFISYFKDWANNVFPKYHQNFSLKPINGKSLSAMFEELKRAQEKSEVDAILQKYINRGDLDRLYARTIALQGEGALFAIPKTGPEMNELVTDLCSATIVALPTKYNSTTYENGITKNTVMKVSQFKTYMEGVIEGLREQLYVKTTNTDDTSSAGDTSGGTSIATTTIDLTNNTDDIKVGVYNYIKMLYDKWVASGDVLDRYSMEKMFYSNDHTFHFIDSFYNKIGKTMFLNMGTIVDIIYSCQSQNGYSLLSMLSGIYASNKFQFLCIQNFLDLSKKSNIETMFKPIPYIEMERPDNHPDFVVLYPYEASSKLDVDGADYPDDTFYLNESTTWPAMINSKSDTDPAIPAFGVTYGQMYQNYFKNIQVDMNTPMVTEQSIKAKFMVAGALQPSQNNGTRITTVGQDLYTIYSNNSYTCTVTMMGCAWVQPMMYFVLQNVPMFRGSYLICKVSHQITPGDMITTFVGVRMSKHATRAVKEFIYGSITTYNGGLTDAESFAARNANVGNDCEWAFYDPNGSGVIDGSVVVAESPVTQKDRLHIDQNSSARCKNPSGMKRTKTEYYEYQTMTDGYKATALLLLKYLNGQMRQCPKNPTVIEICAGWIHGHKFSEMSSSLQAETTTEGNKRAKTAGLAPNVKLPITKDILLRLTMSFGIHEVSYLNKAEATNGVNAAWSEYTSNGGKADVIQPSAKASSGNTKKTMYNNFAQAIQSSLKASEAYANVNVTMTDRGKGWILLSASGTNANNALFDCLIQTYSNWWSSAYFGCNSNKISGEPYGVHVYMTSGSSTTHNISTYDKSTNKTVQLTRKEDVNEGFKMSMIKYFRKNSITDVTKAKAILKSIGQMPDDTIKEVFELGKDSGTIQNCNSLMGSPGVGIEGGYVRNGVSSLFTKGDVGKYNLICHRYAKINGAYQDVIYEYDTGKVICYAMENPTYVREQNKYVGSGKIHTIEFGCQEVFATKHHPGLSYYSTSRVAGKYGCGSQFGAKHTVLSSDGSGCAFHAGQHAHSVSKGKIPWTTGCVLVGSEPNPTTGERNYNEFFKCYYGDYKKKAFITSTCPEIVWIRNFYKHVIDAFEKGLIPQIEYVTNLSGKPKIYGPTGITTTTSSSTGGNTGNLVSLKSELTRNGLKEGVDFEMVIPYATNNNFTKKVIPGYKSGQKDTYACRTMAAAVVKAIKYMNKQYPGKYKLAIFDCFRPKEACYSMADYARKHNSSWLGTYVADAKRGETPKSNHYKGAAIDVSLKYRNGGYLDMGRGQGTGPGGFDNFSNKAHYNSSNANQKLLNTIMRIGGGLSAYKNEWWHFQSTGGVSGGEKRYDK